MVNLPNSLHDASSVIIGRNVYVVWGGTPDPRSFENVQVYNIDTGKWCTLRPAPQYWAEAISIGNNLVLIGGRESSNEKASNMVSTWLEDEGRWSQTIPPMSTKRIRPGVLQLKKFVFVFGGRGEEGEDILDSFELLDIEKNQWINGHGLLSQPLWYLKLGVFGDVVVLTSARTSRYTTTTKAWMIPVRVLEDSVTNSSSQTIQWTPISDSPYHSSSLLTNSITLYLLVDSEEIRLLKTSIDIHLTIGSLSVNYRNLVSDHPSLPSAVIHSWWSVDTLIQMIIRRPCCTA